MNAVSIVMSTYNRGHMLPLAVRSALGQRTVDLELIVVNNGSTDATQAILEGIRDDRLRVIHNTTSLGPIGGRNTGLAAAQGDWVAIHDDDDLWAPDKLKAQIEAASAAQRSWAYVGCVYVDDDGELLGGVPPVEPEQLMVELPSCYAVRGGISNIAWRREALDEDGLLDARLAMTADWDLALRLARRGVPALAPRPLLAFRQHGSNMSQRAAQFQAEFDVIEAKHAELIGADGIDRGVQYRFAAGESLRAGARLEAARSYWRGWRSGDSGCLKRAPALLVPRRLHPLLRRRLLSDPAWLAQARPWLEAYAVPEVLQA